jgi:hypothetical protein
MIISKATARIKLEIPQTQLKEWENSVSAEAIKFHRYRHSLLSKINQLLSGKLPFVKKNEVEVLEKRYSQISSIVADLTAFFDDKSKLEGEITQCQQRKLNPDNQKLRYWLKEHCKNWQQQLSKLGIDSLRESEINADEAELTIIQKEFTLYNKAVHLFQKANEILATLNSSIDTAQLETKLPLFKQGLLENNPDERWLKELEALVSPLIPQLVEAQQKIPEKTADNRKTKPTQETIKDMEHFLPKTEEISIDSALIHQWFLSKSHLPVMRDYTHPRLDELSLNHTAPQQNLAKQEQSSFSSPKIIPVDLKTESHTQTSSYSSPKIIPVDLKSENYRNSESSTKIVFVDLNS